jgi:hypothetical protein
MIPFKNKQSRLDSRRRLEVHLPIYQQPGGDKTGEADLMAAINSINQLDHDLYKLNLEFEGEWHNREQQRA